MAKQERPNDDHNPGGPPPGGQHHRFERDQETNVNGPQVSVDTIIRNMIGRMPSDSPPYRKLSMYGVSVNGLPSARASIAMLIHESK